MAAFEIPLAGVAERFSIALAGTTYHLTVQWREAPLGGWFLDIADELDAPIVLGLALVVGINLLEPYAYLRIAGGAALYIVSNDGGDSAPDFKNLGTGRKLILVTV
jgi:hypothetical protein